MHSSNLDQLSAHAASVEEAVIHIHLILEHAALWDIEWGFFTTDEQQGNPGPQWL